MNAYVSSTRGFRNGGGVSCYDNLYGGGGFSSVAAASSATLSSFVLFNGVVDGFYGLSQSTLIHWSIGRRMCIGGAGYGYGYSWLPAATPCACCCFNKAWQSNCLLRKQRRGRWIASLKWGGDGEDCCDSGEDGDDFEMVGFLRNSNAKFLMDGRRRGENAQILDSRSEKSRKMGKVRVNEAKVDLGEKCVKHDVVSRTVEKYRNARREGSRQFDSGSSYYSATSGSDFENSLDLISAADNKRLSRKSGAELVVKMEDDARVKERKFVGESSRNSKKKEIQERTKIRRSEDRVVESATRDDVDAKEILEYQLHQKSNEGFTKNSQRASRVEIKEDTSSSFVHSKHSAKNQSILENKAYSGREERKSQRVGKISDLCLSGGQNAAMLKESSTSRIAQNIVTNSSALLSMENTKKHDSKDSVKLESLELARLNSQKHDTSEHQTQIVSSSHRSSRKEHEMEEDLKRQRRSDFDVVTQLDAREESRRLALGSDINTSTSNWKGTTDKKKSFVSSKLFDEESTVKYNQAAKQSNKRHESRVESQKLAQSSHEIERTSSSHTMTRTKWQKQQSTSTEELSEAASSQLDYSKIQSLPQHGSKISGSSSPLKSSSQGHVSAKAGAEITHTSNSTLQVKVDVLESARHLDKSSKHFVGEFVDKAKEEISYTHGLIISSKEEKYKRDEHDINVNIQMNLDDLRQSSSSEHGPKGPSDEMWSEVVLPSVAELPGKGNDSPKAAEEAKTPRDAESSSGKKSSRSLWVFLGDIVRTWSSRSEARKTTAKSNAKSSSNESAASETWFSGNEPDGAEDDDKSRTERVSGRSGTSNVYSRSQSLPSNSSKNQDSIGSLDEKNEAEVDSLTSLGSGGIRIPPNVSSDTAVSDYFHPTPGVVASPGIPIELAGSSSTISMPVNVASPVLATQLVGSSFTVVYPDEKVQEIRETNVVVNELTNVHVDPIEEKQIEMMGTEVQNTELKRSKLQRNKQVLKERFDEWEEAFIVENEQRKVDEMFMREALVEAKKAADSWEVPVGAVLVQHGKIIARGCNLVEELRDSTAHAEMICIREASNVLRTWRLAETTLYVTLEPCPMCAGAILQSRIDSVVWGAPNKLLGADGSWISLFPSGGDGSGSDRPAGPVHPFHPKMNIRRGVLATECADVMHQFFQLRRKKNKKQDSPPSGLPVSTPTKYFSKMHDMFSMMFCL